METITEDQWGEEVWGAATSSGTNNRDTAHSNLIFYWGKHVSLNSLWPSLPLLMISQDKLVADHTRDKLMADRAPKSKGGSLKTLQPDMSIDELGIPHAFCLSEFSLGVSSQ